VTPSLPLRVDRIPDETVVVIRAGVMTSASVLKAAERTFDLYGLFGISVEGVLDQTVLEACRSSERLEPYRQIRLSTFERLHAAGFPLLATFDSPHFTLVLPDLSELTLARLERSFDEPIPNPAR
jgi:hypothetical protein